MPSTRRRKAKLYASRSYAKRPRNGTPFFEPKNEVIKISADAHHAVVTEVEAGIGLPIDWLSFEGVPHEDGFAQLKSGEDCREGVLAIGYVDEQGNQVVIGSGFMVAPGLLMMATHVLSEMEGHSPVAYAVLPNGRLRLWRLTKYMAHRKVVEPVTHVDRERLYVNDVCLVACELVSEPHTDLNMRLVNLGISLPQVGERLWTLGHVKTNKLDERYSNVAFMGSSGLVTEVYQFGRGELVPGPSVEVAMQSVGGMSGAPVFNAKGRVIGLVSRSFDAEDGICGPTTVALIWHATTLHMKSSWPPNFWTSAPMADFLTPIEFARRRGMASMHGHVQHIEGRFIAYLSHE